MRNQHKSWTLLSTLFTGDEAGVPGERRSVAPVTALERKLLLALLGALGNPPLDIVTWNGEHIMPEGVVPTVSMHINTRGALWRLVFNPDHYFGDDYSSGAIEVDGNLTEFLETVMRQRPPAHQDGLLRRLIKRWHRARPNSLSGSRRNIQHHYDIGNDFYRLWLDEEMVYTCAYFPDPALSLEAAQVAKMDHVCRKLELKPGQTVFEAGCGWGGLARHMAKHYGVKVKAYNVSHQQILYAREKSKQQGLDHLLEYVEDDYRNMRGQCDAFVSVGMLEHVGVEHYRELGRVIERTLARHGRGLIHSIGQNAGRPMNSWIERNIFPGAYPPTLGEMMDIFRPYDLSVLDVENLRLHYAKTLEHWLARYEQHRDEVERLFDPRFLRAWRFYLASSTASFLSGGLQLYQVVFNHHDCNDIPWSRAHLYRDDPSAASHAGI